MDKKLKKDIRRRAWGIAHTFINVGYANSNAKLRHYYFKALKYIMTTDNVFNLK